MNRSCSLSVSRAGALRASFGACSPAVMRAALKTAVEWT